MICFLLFIIFLNKKLNLQIFSIKINNYFICFMTLKSLKKILFFLLLNILYSNIYSQNSILVNSEDSLLNKLIKIKLEVNKEMYEKNYYSIQLFSGDFDNAEKIYLEFSSYFPNLKKTLTFETPNYKVRVGNFEKKINADIKLEEIKKKYKSAFVLQPENL